jgi:hypothetical protein
MRKIWRLLAATGVFVTGLVSGAPVAQTASVGEESTAGSLPSGVAATRTTTPNGNATRQRIRLGSVTHLDRTLTPDPPPTPLPSPPPTPPC